MIDRTCFESKWITSKHRETNADPILIEKAIYVFELLGNLVENGINLVFKGGTGLILLIPELKRLSIDLDIITEEEDITLHEAFDIIVREGLFKKWEEDKRLAGHNVPKRHFKFYYTSRIENRDSHVLLDIVKMSSPFPETIEKPIIIPPLFEVKKEVKVTIPTVNGFTGDKLSAFAPTTIGILYGSGKSMEIIKQLFDLGILFEHITDLKEISQTYKKIAEIESSYRNMSLPADKFLDDSIQASFLISQLGFRSIENDYTKELKCGIGSIKSHIIGGKYSFSNAEKDASKVACLAFLIKDGRLDIDIGGLTQNRGLDVERIKDVLLPEEFGILNKLKQSSPKSFYLWAIATEVI